MEIDSRVRINQLVSLQPGLHLRELQRLLGLSFNSTRYHVEKMAKGGEIRRIEDGGYSRLFPARTEDEDAILLSAMRRSTNLRILSCLVTKRSLSQGNLCTVTGMAKSTVSETMKRLLELGVIRTETHSGSRTRYELTNPAKVKVLLNRNIGLLGKATARYIDLWDF